MGESRYTQQNSGTHTLVQRHDTAAASYLQRIKRHVPERSQDAGWSNHWRWDTWRESGKPRRTVYIIDDTMSIVKHLYWTRLELVENRADQDTSSLTDPQGRCRALIAKEHLRELTDAVFSCFRRRPHLERFDNGATSLAKLPPTTRSITKNSKTQTLGVFAAQVPPSEFSLSLPSSNVADGRCKSWLTAAPATLLLLRRSCALQERT